MLDFLLQYDHSTTSFLHTLLPHILFLNTVFSFFSLTGASLFIWFIIVLPLFIKEEIEDKKFLFVFGLNFAVTYILNDFILKNLFHRLRPFLSNSPVSTDFNQTAILGGLISTICPRDFSFPSTHAATAFAAATILSHYDPKRKVLYHAVAFLISFSRIYLGCHFFFDTVVGGLLGVLISHFILLLPFSYNNRKSKR